MQKDGSYRKQVLCFIIINDIKVMFNTIDDKLTVIKFFLPSRKTQSWKGIDITNYFFSLNALWPMTRIAPGDDTLVLKAALRITAAPLGS